MKKDELIKLLNENGLTPSDVLSLLANEIPYWELQYYSNQKIKYSTRVYERDSNHTLEELLNVGFNNLRIYDSNNSFVIEEYDKEYFTKAMLEAHIKDYESYQDDDGYLCAEVKLKETKEELFTKDVEALGWSVDKQIAFNKEITFVENWSPKGEDLLFEGESFEILLNNIINGCKNFDVDKHVKLWINNPGHGQPNDVEVLLEDAKAISDMYEKLLHIAELYF